jgi:phycobilisome core-membrane linker protein
MHRRLLGRPTFGRWEIDAYFDTAARKGFYGVVEAMLSSREYTTCFGEDTVPYERFITPADRNARRIPALRSRFNPASYAAPAGVRPDVSTSQSLRTTGDLTNRNLPNQRRVIVGGWSANLSGGQVQPKPPAATGGPGSIREQPLPTRRWRPSAAPQWRGAPVSPSPTQPLVQPLVQGGWSATVSSGAAGLARQPGQAMAARSNPDNPRALPAAAAWAQSCSCRLAPPPPRSRPPSKRPTANC